MVSVHSLQEERFTRMVRHPSSILFLVRCNFRDDHRDWTGIENRTRDGRSRGCATQLSTGHHARFVSRWVQ